MPPKKKPDMELGASQYFYNDTIELRFSKRDHIYYRVDGDKLTALDGVTHVSGILDKSMYLIPWACKMMAEKLLRTVESQEGYIRSVSTEDFTTLVNASKSASRDKMDDASNVGGMAHLWLEKSIFWAIHNNDGIVEQLVADKPADERAINCGNSALAWMQRHNVRWLKTEQKVYSKQYEFAGTMDGLALVDGCSDFACCPRMYMDELALIDWKSSNYLHLHYLYQTAAYQQAEQEEHGTKIAARWILRLGKDEGDFESWYETDFENDFAAFLHCLALKRAHKVVEKRMSEAKKLRTFHKREAKKQAKKGE